MAFQRSRDLSPGSSRWRATHRTVLLKWLPDHVVRSDRLLTYVLLHGTEVGAGGWSATALAPEEAASFLVFLESAITNPTGYELLECLRRRARGDVG